MNKILSPEEWLNENHKKDDWSITYGCLHDGLFTNNVIKYMKDYAEYVKSNISEVHLIIDTTLHGFEAVREISLDYNKMLDELADLDSDTCEITTLNLI